MHPGGSLFERAGQEIESSSSNEYRIQEGDILKIAFSFEKDLNQDDVVVLSDGAISLMGADRLQVAGLTINQTDSLVTKAYEKDVRSKRA